MRAAFFETQRSMRVRDVPVAEPPPGEVRVRVTYCGVCGSDLSMFKGGALAGPNVVLGHEIVGVVDRDPGGDWEPGTRVAVWPPTGCGRCVWCVEGRPRYCVEPLRGRWGGFAEYTAYPSQNLVPVPDAVDDQVAALADPLGVGVRAVEIARPQSGDLAYVAGLGAIGLSTASLLAAAGCRVIGADPVADRRRLAKDLGCEQVIDPATNDPYEVGLSLDPHGFRFAFECSGNPRSLQEIFDACGHAGTVGILGIPTQPVLLLRMTVREQQAFSIAGPDKVSIEAALEHGASHPELAGMVTSTVGLDDLQPTMELLADGKGGIKVLVDPAK
jgi:threonine dehydrogenase-like Zn-dependent dehydrogenase